MPGQVTRRSGIMTAAFLLLTCAANAHVEIIPNEVRANDFARVAFRVAHGCETQPTTRLTIQVPEGVTLMRPQMKATPWKMSTKTIQYPEPVTAGDKTFTEGFSEVTWEGGSIPSGYFDDFIILFLPPHRPGTSLRIMAVQECANTPEPQEFPLELKLSPMPADAGQPGSAPAANTAAAAEGDEADLEEAESGVPLILAVVAILMSAAALVVALRRRD